MIADGHALSPAGADRPAAPASPDSGDACLYPSVLATLTPPRSLTLAQHARRAGIGAAGGTLVGLGAILTPLPGPGLLIIGAGMMVLGTEFPGAKRVMDRGVGALVEAIEGEESGDEHDDDSKISSGADGGGGSSGGGDDGDGEDSNSLSPSDESKKEMAQESSFSFLAPPRGLLSRMAERLREGGPAAEPNSTEPPRGLLSRITERLREGGPAAEPTSTETTASPSAPKPVPVPMRRHLEGAAKAFRTKARAAGRIHMLPALKKHLDGGGGGGDVGGGAGDLGVFTRNGTDGGAAGVPTPSGIDDNISAGDGADQVRADRC